MNVREELRRFLGGLPKPAGYLVAFSGGGDSTALLHAIVAQRQELGAPLRAVHVDHGLHPNSSRWAAHCRRICKNLGVDLLVREVSVAPGQGESVESAARELRYRCFCEVLGESEMLLTAHTRDDQAETVLLRLMRGSGLEGLSGIPRLRRFGAGWLARPLLDTDRDELRQWLRSRKLDWLEDPDNRNLERSRVFLRAEILPRLRAHWPGADAVVARAADNLVEAAAALREYAEADLSRCLTPAGDGLPLAALRDMSPPRRRQVMRAWLRECCLRGPDRARLAELERQALQARGDARLTVAWPGAEVHRFRDTLYVIAPPAPLDSGTALHWRTDRPLALPAGLGELRLQATGAAPAWEFTVRFRRGGERIRLPGRNHRTELKSLLQEWGVPPWERNRLPLMFKGDELLSVADLQPSREFDERLAAAGATLRWERG